MGAAVASGGIAVAGGEVAVGAGEVAVAGGDVGVASSPHANTADPRAKAKIKATICTRGARSFISTLLWRLGQALNEQIIIPMRI